MSVEALSWALNLTDPPLQPTQALVLIGIANHDGDGGAWPSVDTLARYARITPRSVQRILVDLVALGLVEITPQAGGTAKTRADRRPNLYRLIRHGVTPTSSRETPRGDAGVVDGVTPVSPEPSCEPSLERPDGTPPLTKKQKARAEADAIVRAWWDWHKEQTGDAPTAQPFPRVVEAVARLVEAGYGRVEIKHGLIDANRTTTITTGTVETAIKRRRAGHGLAGPTTEDAGPRSAFERGV